MIGIILSLFSSREYFRLSIDDKTELNLKLYSKFTKKKYYNIDKLVVKIVYHVHLRGYFYNSCLTITKYNALGMPIGYINQQKFILESSPLIPLNQPVVEFYDKSINLNSDQSHYNTSVDLKNSKKVS